MVGYHDDLCRHETGDSFQRVLSAYAYNPIIHSGSGYQCITHKKSVVRILGLNTCNKTIVNDGFAGCVHTSSLLVWFCYQLFRSPSALSAYYNVRIFNL